MRSLTLTPRFFTFIALGVGAFFVLLFLSQGTVQAATCPNNRYICNNAEKNARNNCAAVSPQVYGAIWFNNTGGAATDDGYYASYVIVNGTANSVTVNIRGSVFDCNDGVGVGQGVWATGVAPQGANAWRLTGLSSTTLYRGNYSGINRWTSRGGSISATLNVSNLPNGNAAGTQTFTIDLYRCYSSNGSSATGSCYAETITITVIRVNVPANYQPLSDVNGTSAPSTIYANPTSTANFRLWNRISNYGGANHAMVGLAQMRIGSGGSWQNVHQHSYTATANGNTFFWTQNGVGPGATITGNQLGGGSYVIPANTDEICFRLQITNNGGAILASGATNPSGISCMRIRGGNTQASATASPSHIEPGDFSDLVATIHTNSFRWLGQAGASYNVTCSWTITGLASGSLSPTGTSGTCNQAISSNNPIVVVNKRYTATTATPIGTQVCLNITLGVPAGLGTSSTQQACTTVVAKPYLKAFGADVRAGCTDPAVGGGAGTASISSWNRGSAAGFAGAGGIFAAFALGTIDEFASAQGGSTAAGLAPPGKGLSFASAPGSYGGSYGTGSCLADYYGSRPTAARPGELTLTPLTTTSWGAGSAAANPGIHQVLTRTGNLTVNGGTLQPGTRVTLYVQGDVAIAGNITAASATAGDVLSIPSLTIVACGNIAIGSGVQQLHTVLIAQARTGSAACDTTTPNGQIYTCANGFSVLPVTPANYATCNNQLVVTGALLAQRVHFTRTFGTLSRHGSAAADFLRSGNGVANAAEVIQYNPLTWILPAGTVNSSSGPPSYDAVTTLPPVL